jgi:superfamily II DNA or RNA helicase
MVIIRRINNKEYSFADNDGKMVRQVCHALTFKNPDPFAYSSKITKFNKRNLTFYIGMLRNVREYLDSKKISYKIEDYKYPKLDIAIDDRLRGMYRHQAMAVEEFYKRRFGIVVVPTRGGKTYIAAEILRIFLQKESGQYLFITDNITLFEQAKNDFCEYFKRYGGIIIGEIRSGNIDTSKRVTIAMIQTIQSALSNRCSDASKRKQVKNYLKKLQFLCVDEIHENCSDSKLRIYKMCRELDYQLCLSATPYRSGTYVQNLKLQEWSGDIVYEITESELRKRGVLSEYKVFMLLIDHNQYEYDIEDADYNDYRKKLIFENEQRNSILLQLVSVLRELNLKTLMLFQSVEHGRHIGELLGETFISGETKSDVREQVKREFLEKNGGFLLASNIFKKGVTLPQAEVLINCDEGLEDANTVQRKGRIMGATENKKRSLVIDFFDLYDLYFSDHSETRLNTYVSAVGERRIGLLDTSNADWIVTFRRWTEKWFNL